MDFIQLRKTQIKCLNVPLSPLFKTTQEPVFVLLQGREGWQGQWEKDAD